MHLLTSFVARRRWIFFSFLGVLHLVFLQGPDSLLGRLFFLAHIGIGLLWQPFVQPRRRMGWVATLCVVSCAALFAYYLNWGLLVIWTMLLAGVVGGKIFLFPNRWERAFHLTALGYLVLALLALVLPQALRNLHLVEPLFDKVALYLAPMLLVLMAALPVERSSAWDHGEFVDYVYSVLMFLLLAVIVLGSLSFSFLFVADYFEALLMTLALVAGTLLLLGFIWDPRAGFSGLGSAVAQHVMSLGLPIESWLESLARFSEQEEDPERFLALACAALPQRLPGVEGGHWDVLGRQGDFGRAGTHRVGFTYGHLKLVLFCRERPSPSLLWHHDMAVRLLAEFYLGKWRAQELKRLSYIEAIHETGARLTHDMKNLLQSLETLCLAAEQEGSRPSPRFHELLRRQLPEIAVRLRQTLAKLATPGRAADTAPMAADAWLAALENRYAADWVAFGVTGDPAASVIDDPGLFSSIAENLLQNIADKRRLDPAIRAEVRLGQVEGKPWLEVRDSGGAVPAEVVSRLFAQHAPSETGLGIGLYQSARLAEEKGYRLVLGENRDGRVCFRLAPAHQNPA